MRNEVGLFAMVIVDRFHRQQVDRHVIDARHLFFEDEMIAKRLDAVEALQFRLLGDEERHLAFFQAGHVALQQVVAYEVESLFPSLLQVFAYDVTLELKVMPFFTAGWERKNSSSIALSSSFRSACRSSSNMLQCG